MPSLDPQHAGQSENVARQYERWTYPPPVDDLEQLPLAGPYPGFKDLRELHPSYWPAEAFSLQKEVLVAGCGTMAAACYAYLYPEARVTGIDRSAASLAHEEKLKSKYQLSNLSLIRGDISDVTSLGLQFDYIAVHGVLHHIPEAVQALTALRSVLGIEGVISIMLYAKYGRAGVYLMQDFFRLLGCGQEPDDVAVVRETLASVGPAHPVRSYLQTAIDLHADSGIVDTFLHPFDRCYSVGDCLDLLAAADLVFQDWDEPFFYYPDLAFAHLGSDSSLRRKVASLREPEIWKAMELFGARMPGHFFHACRRDRPSEHWRIDLNGPHFEGLQPVPRHPPGRRENGVLILHRPPLTPLRFTPLQSQLMEQVDGVRTVAECIANVRFPAGSNPIAFARTLFGFCKRMGYLLFRIPRDRTVDDA